jgi:flagellar biosynthetic protein FlhB
LLVAKGQDLVALQIRKVAGHHAVPELSAPPLARALFYSTELNQPIPVGLYLAVAQVLAYVFQLRQHREQGGPKPAPVGELPIPEELQR